MAVSSEINLDPVDAILDAMAASRASGNLKYSVEDIIPILQEIQKRYGYLPTAALRQVSGRTGIPESHIQGVASFYAQFYREPRGRHTITVCCGTACHVRGGHHVLEVVRDVLGVDQAGIDADPDINLETAACLGTCALAPVMVVDDKYHGKLTASKAEQVVYSLIGEDRL
jgi:NADH-quinone oxidoreductase subunit E